MSSHHQNSSIHKIAVSKRQMSSTLPSDVANKENVGTAASTLKYGSRNSKSTEHDEDRSALKLIKADNMGTISQQSVKGIQASPKKSRQHQGDSVSKSSKETLNSTRKETSDKERQVYRIGSCFARKRLREQQKAEARLASSTSSRFSPISDHSQGSESGIPRVIHARPMNDCEFCPSIEWQDEAVPSHAFGLDDLEPEHAATLSYDSVLATIKRLSLCDDNQMHQYVGDAHRTSNASASIAAGAENLDNLPSSNEVISKLLLMLEEQKQLLSYDQSANDNSSGCRDEEGEEPQGSYQPTRFNLSFSQAPLRGSQHIDDITGVDDPRTPKRSAPFPNGRHEESLISDAFTSSRSSYASIAASPPQQGRMNWCQFVTSTTLQGPASPAPATPPRHCRLFSPARVTQSSLRKSTNYG